MTGSESSWGEAQSKLVEWFDPMRSATSVRALSGLDALRGIADGVIAPPPIAALFGFNLVEVGEGTVTFTCSPDESAYNPIGMVHGGLVCTLLDTVVGCAVHTSLAAGVGYTSIELKVNYLRAVHAHSGLLRAEGRLIKPGRRVAFAEGDVRDAEGKLLATASGSCLIMPAE